MNGRRCWLFALCALGACAPDRPYSVRYDEEGRILVHPALSTCVGDAGQGSVRVATWNVAAGQRGSLSEVASELERVDADVVALQEVDSETERAGGVDQPRWLAHELGYEFVFAEALGVQGGSYGLAVLTRLPVADVERRELYSELSSEPRIVLDVTVCADRGELEVLNLHADYRLDAAREQLHGLAEGPKNNTERSLVVGDFNLQPDDEALVAFLERCGLTDVFAGRDDGPTRGSRRIDYVLASRGLAEGVASATRVESDASDHHLLVAEFDGA
jgi:endonuclease/exonuclease/phosphatase family metal-dependent hydrolase